MFAREIVWSIFNVDKVAASRVLPRASRRQRRRRHQRRCRRRHAFRATRRFRN